MRYITHPKSGFFAAFMLMLSIFLSYGQRSSGAECGVDTVSDNAAATGGSSQAPAAPPASDKNVVQAGLPLPAAPRSREVCAVKAVWDDVNGWKRIIHVSLQSELSSKNSFPGDPVWGLLDEDLFWGARLIARKDSLIRGHVLEVALPRTLFSAAFSKDRRLKTEGSIDIQFDEIVDEDGKSWPIFGKVCRSSSVGSERSARSLEVDKQGRILSAGPTLSESERSVFLAVRAASCLPVPGAMAIGLLGVPVVMGAAGAAYPAFAYDRPVDSSEKGIRQKAFVYGLVTNLPGVGIVQGCVQKGMQTNLSSGDQLVVDLTFKQNEFSRGDVNVVETASEKHN